MVLAAGFGELVMVGVAGSSLPLWLAAEELINRSRAHGERRPAPEVRRQPIAGMAHPAH